MVALVSSQETMVSLVPQDNILTLVSRTGRHMQRYHKGRRQVVGCIPYRLRGDSEEVQVLVITSQKGNGLLFPKGGWETDESMVEAASRETVEEAGVRGTIEKLLGQWSFKSKSRDSYYDGYMFPLLVKEQLDIWPERNVRTRLWMGVGEARQVCQYWWMKEALDILVQRIGQEQQHEDEGEGEGEGEGQVRISSL